MSSENNYEAPPSDDKAPPAKPIPDDYCTEVAKAIELAHYPGGEETVTGQAFMQDAKTFIAAYNACATMPPKEEPKPTGEEVEAGELAPAA